MTALFEIHSSKSGQTAVFIDDTLANVTGAQAASLHGIHHQSWPQTKTAVENWLDTHTGKKD